MFHAVGTTADLLPTSSVRSNQFSWHIRATELAQFNAALNSQCELFLFCSMLSGSL